MCSISLQAMWTFISVFQNVSLPAKLTRPGGICVWRDSAAGYLKTSHVASICRCTVATAYRILSFSAVGNRAVSA